MIIDWSIDGNINFTVYDYLEDILAKTSDDFNREDITPAVSDLFQVDGACRKLDTKMEDLFSRFAARLTML